MRQYTKEEVREKFIRQVNAMCAYWSELEGYDKKSAVEGVAFSILNILDGGSLGLPAFIVAPLPAEEDKDYSKEHNENWFPQNHKSDIKCDIAGGLHELMGKYK